MPNNAPSSQSKPSRGASSPTSTSSASCAGKPTALRIAIGTPTLLRLVLVVVFVPTVFVAFAGLLASLPAAIDRHPSSRRPDPAYAIIRRLPGGAEVRTYAATAPQIFSALPGSTPSAGSSARTAAGKSDRPAVPAVADVGRGIVAPFLLPTAAASAAAGDTATKLVIALPFAGPFRRSNINAIGAVLVEALSADGTLRPLSDELRPWSARSVTGTFFWPRGIHGEVFIEVLISANGEGPSAAQLVEARLLSPVGKGLRWMPPATMLLVFFVTACAAVRTNVRRADSSSSQPDGRSRTPTRPHAQRLKSR